jgi:hypothetical protein
LGITLGTICHDRPNLSVSQPHWISLPAGAEFFPVVIDFVLGLAVDDKRDGRRELIVLAAIEANERLPLQLKGHRHRRTRRPRPGRPIAHDLLDLRVGKDRNIKLSRLLRLRIEPKKRA